MEIINIFISSIVLMSTICLFGKIVINKLEKTNFEMIVIILVSSIIHTIIYMCTENSTKTILICLLYTITFNKVYEISLVKALFLSTIYVILLVIPDLLTLVVATKIFQMSKDVCHFYFAGTILGNIIVCIIMILLAFLLKKPLKKLLEYNFSTNIKIILVSLMTLISLAIFFYNLINTFRLNNNIIGYLVVIITLIFILFYLFKQKIDNDIILKKYDELLNVMKTYESDIEEQRTMIHETRNELTTIKCKIEDKSKVEEIIEYIDSILDDKTSSNMSKYSKFKYLPSNGIKGFFYYKFMEAEKNKIKVSVNISKKIENSFLANLDTKDFKDLVRMIGVYLDNAIDASAESKEKKLGIEIYLVKNDIEIIISNTFENEVNIEKIGKEKFTTKGKNHGHGLLLVKHILHNNSIFDEKNEVVNNLYVQKLKIKNNKQ